MSRHLLPFSILLILILAACNGAAFLPPLPLPPAATAPNQQSLNYLSSFTAAPAQRWNQDTLTAFQQQNPHIKVEHAALAADSYLAQLPSWLRQHPAPDVLVAPLNYELRQLAADGLVLGLDDIWQEAGWDTSLPTQFRSAITVAGEPSFLPVSWYWWGLWYRKSLFAAAGIEPPHTWDELLQSCDALRAADYIPITIGLQERWPAAAWFDYLDLRLNGADFHKRLLAGQERYDSAPVRDVFDHWAQLMTHQCFIDAPQDLTWLEALDFMKQKQAGMYLMGSFLMQSVPSDQRSDYDFVPFPSIRPDIPPAEDVPLDVFLIPRNAAQPTAALHFLSFVGSRAVQADFARSTGRLPAQAAALPSAADPLQHKGFALIAQAQDISQFYDRDTPQAMADAGLTAMLHFWRHPGQTTAVMQEMESARQQVFGGQ
ncbi:MAG: carbohydrate ABC transporter substrate-binding protein [Chloroflexi bacterium]|nr:carbohydrate ABC transporter substrate-binding protein [Chloroflexota bacterium]